MSEVLIGILAAIIVTVLLFRVMTAMGNRALRQIQQQDSPVCRHCGYDLRASGDRCPECGTLIAGDWSFEPDIARMEAEWPATPIPARKPGDAEMQTALWKHPYERTSEIVTDFVRAHGFAASMTITERHQTFGTMHRTYAEAALMVWEPDIDAVKELLHRYRNRAAPTTD